MTTRDELQTACRTTLARLRVSGRVLFQEVRADVRRELLDRELITENDLPGYIHPTPRAAGYCANPSTFVL